ncbi:hypothetical protein AB0C70_29130 [Streptomyces sp. NPDC048564]|uniref:hypothetical protein n=1 Tax=Streptomyces sp. NPDC048564 TaxID=3155760 RepID=UPI003448A215
MAVALCDAQGRMAQRLGGDPGLLRRPSTSPAPAAADRLAVRCLDGLAFTNEPVAGELVTSAIRHATGPVQLRLLRDRAPARTRAARGLFLVSQLTECWETRNTPYGKIIRTEQPLP